MFCKHCGAQIEEDAKFCPRCGNKIEDEEIINPEVMDDKNSIPSENATFVPTQNTKSKSKVAAALLAFFLGPFGAHNFYLGHNGKAIAQLLITLLTGWIFGIGAIVTAIWSFVEFIMILTGSIKDADGNDLSN